MYVASQSEAKKLEVAKCVLEFSVILNRNTNEMFFSTYRRGRKPYGFCEDGATFTFLL